MWPVNCATCCIDGYRQMTTWFWACPAEKPCVVTSSFDVLLKSMLQTCRRKPVSESALRSSEESAHLAPRVDLLQQVAGHRVPEAQLLVGGAAATRENAMLMGIPSDRFDCRDVIGKAMERCLRKDTVSPHIKPES